MHLCKVNILSLAVNIKKWEPTWNSRFWPWVCTSGSSMEKMDQVCVLSGNIQPVCPICLLSYPRYCTCSHNVCLWLLYGCSFPPVALIVSPLCDRHVAQGPLSRRHELVESVWSRTAHLLKTRYQRQQGKAQPASLSGACSQWPTFRSQAHHSQECCSWWPYLHYVGFGEHQTLAPIFPPLKGQQVFDSKGKFTEPFVSFVFVYKYPPVTSAILSPLSPRLALLS